MVDKQPKFDVICFGGEDWWYHNRGHTDMQLMRRFAVRGTVLYVNSIVIQKPNIRQGRRFLYRLYRKAKSIFMGLKKSGEGFWVYSPVSIPLHHISWARTLNEKLVRFQINRVLHKLAIRNPLVWVACPGACDIALKTKKSKLVYQRTDSFEDFPGVDFDTVREYDQKLKSNADLTVYVNSNLYEKELSQCKRAMYLDHGVDFETFALAQQNPDKPVDIAGIQQPIVGYFGALDDHKLDIGFIEKVVDLLPNMSFVFIGKASLNYSELTVHDNVWLLGQKDYEQIPHYGKCFDVAIIPWRKNRWTEAANPIKLKEYLALGKPLVSTPAFTELRGYLDVVYQAEAAEDFAECIKRALAENSPELVTARRKKVEKSSWNSKAQLVLGELFGADQCLK